MVCREIHYKQLRKHSLKTMRDGTRILKQVATEKDLNVQSFDVTVAMVNRSDFESRLYTAEL